MARMLDLDLVLVRHGEPDGDWHGRFLGRSDPELGEVGRSQVTALAEALPGLIGERRPLSIHASPLLRAMQTAAPLAEVFDLQIAADERLMEIDFGSWDGLHGDEVERHEPGAPGRWFADPSTVAPGGGETFADVAERIGSWIEELPRPTGPVVVVAHFGVCAVCAAMILGLPLSHADRLCLHRGQAGRIHHGVLNWWGVPTRDPGRRRAFSERPG